MDDEGVGDWSGCSLEIWKKEQRMNWGKQGILESLLFFSKSHTPICSFFHIIFSPLLLSFHSCLSFFFLLSPLFLHLSFSPSGIMRSPLKKKNQEINHKYIGSKGLLSSGTYTYKHTLIYPR